MAYDINQELYWSVVDSQTSQVQGIYRERKMARNKAARLNAIYGDAHISEPFYVRLAISTDRMYTRNVR